MDLRAQIARILLSPPFVRSPRMQRFLEFLCAETLAGKASQLKEYTIAISVFGKDADFEPATNPVVRVEAGRLRRLLMQYRVEYGSSDPIIVDVPKGSYVPAFARTRHSGKLEESENSERPVRIKGSDRPSDGSTARSMGKWSTTEERRLVTVLSCGFGDNLSVPGGAAADEFVGSFSLFHERCSSIIGRHSGTVDGCAGDRLIAYFGWPDALEDAAGRALTAALGILAAIQQTFPHDSLGIRMGIATSEVVARVAEGPERFVRPAIIGEAPAQATHILARAPLNGILVTEATRRLTGSAFDFIQAGSLEGVAGTGLLWRLLKAKPVETRFRASHVEAETPLVGRREEMALLRSRWRLSRQGEGQGVIILGDAGIGKSKLAEAVLTKTRHGCSQLRLQCSPHHANSTLHPFLEWLRVLISTRAGTADPLDPVVTAYGLDGTLDRAILAELLSVPGAEPTSLSANRRKELTLGLLTRLLRAQVGRSPTVLLIEDIHWADPTSLELLDSIFDMASDVRLMVIATGREEVSSQSVRKPNVTSLVLNRLPKRHCCDLLDLMSRAAPLSAGARSLILDRADGIPLFLEELAKLFQSSDASCFGAAPIPESLSDLLASQLDRLGPARSVAQMAAVIGREFSGGMLGPALELSEADTDAALDQLLTAGVIVRQGADSADLYSFRHALIRDAAYGSLLAGARRTLHGRIADLLIESFPETTRNHPEIVARHLTVAQRHEAAYPYWLDAGRKAVTHYALAEAIADFRCALGAAKALPSTPGGLDREIASLVELGLAIRIARGYGDPELLALYQRTRTLCEELGRHQQLAETLFGLWTHAAGHGQWRTAEDLADEFDVLAESLPKDRQLKVETSRLRGAAAVFRGRFAQARTYFRKALEHYDSAACSPRFGFDPGATSAAYLAWTSWHLGEFIGADDWATKALSIAEQRAHTPTLALVLTWLTFLEVLRENFNEVTAYNARLQVLCAEHDYRQWQAFGLACEAWATGRCDHQPVHLERLLKAIEDFRDLWGGYFTPCLLLLGADLCRALRLPERGLDLVAAASDFIEAHDERLWEAECSRLTGELIRLTQNPDIGLVEQRLRAAQAVAHRQGALALERRAAASLAALR